MTLRDGLYQVTTNYLCAGFEVEGGVVTRCAPILRRRLAYWMTVAEYVAGPERWTPRYTLSTHHSSDHGRFAVDLQVGIIQVAVVNTQSGRQRFDVSCSDGQVRGIWDAALANAINAYAGGATQVTIRETTKPGRNGQVYRNIVAFAPPGQALPPEQPGGGNGGGGGFNRGGGKGQYPPEVTTRITKLAAYEYATTLVGALFSGAGPEAYAEAMALTDECAKHIYVEARSHEKKGEQQDGATILQPGAQVGQPVQQQGQVLGQQATPQQIAAAVPGVQVGTQALQPGGAADAQAAVDVQAQAASEQGDNIEWD